MGKVVEAKVVGDVRVQVLQEPVGASHGGQGRKLRRPEIFFSPVGEEESNGTPYLAVASKGVYPQGGALFKYIYIDCLSYFVFEILELFSKRRKKSLD